MGKGEQGGRLTKLKGGGRGWMSAMGDRESGRVGGDRSVSVKDETPKQVSKRQTDRQTEYIRNDAKGEEHLYRTQRGGQRTQDSEVKIHADSRSPRCESLVTCCHFKATKQ